MVSKRTGHFVQIYRDAYDYNVPNEYVEVAGKKVLRWNWKAGWMGVSRELSRQDAKRFAKEYQRAGFHARVLFRGNHEKHVTDEFKIRRNKQAV